MDVGVPEIVGIFRVRTDVIIVGRTAQVRVNIYRIVQETRRRWKM